MSVMNPIDKLKHCLEEDKDMCTPDLPSLRYRGKDAYVFIFDNLAESSAFRDRLHQTAGSDYVDMGDALTRLKYLPWYDIGANTFEQETYCLEESLDIPLITLEDESMGPAQKIRGRLFRISLNCLIHLDWWYQNEYNYTRCEIDVQRQFGVKEVLSAYTYMNWVEDVADWDPLKCEHIVKEGISLYPYSTEVIGDEEVYSFA